MLLPPSWQAVVGREIEKPYFRELLAFVEEQRRRQPVYPAEADVFNAFRLTSCDDAKVVILGQDPYHGAGQAHGLSFSVPSPTAPPPSLRNILRELRDDVGCRAPGHGDLTSWGRQGVLLLNAVLTVAAHQPGSHAGRGWETFTDAVITALSARARPLVFCLWGNWARRKAALVDTGRHVVIEGAHPSPLSARKFLGSRPFSRINAALSALGHETVDWQLPDG